MLGRPNRRTLLIGAAVAVAVGAIGVLPSNLDLGAASLSANDQAKKIVIQVQLVRKAGTQDEWSVLAPGARAQRGDEIEWKALTDNIKHIQQVVFKVTPVAPARPNPFSKTNAVIRNPNANATNMNKNVLGDSDLGTFYYKIHVIGKDDAVGRWESDDPPLDIVPGP